MDIKTPAAGDLVIVQYRAPRGGRTHVMHRVAAKETARDVTASLARAINHEWMPEFIQAKVNDKGSLIVNCADAVSDVTFSHDIEGDGGTQLSMMEF
jgi:hypothetical protein